MSLFIENSFSLHWIEENFVKSNFSGLNEDTFKDFIVEFQDTENEIWDDSQDRKVSTALKHIYRRTYFSECDDLMMAVDVAHAAAASAATSAAAAADAVAADASAL